MGQLHTQNHAYEPLCAVRSLTLLHASKHHHTQLATLTTASQPASQPASPRTNSNFHSQSLYFSARPPPRSTFQFSGPFFFLFIPRLTHTHTPHTHPSPPPPVFPPFSLFSLDPPVPFPTRPDRSSLRCLSLDRSFRHLSQAPPHNNSPLIYFHHLSLLVDEPSLEISPSSTPFLRPASTTGCHLPTILHDR